MEKLRSGENLSNKQIIEIFQCGLQGGMRRSHRTNSLVLISDHTKPIYEDTWIDNVFHYTGMGMAGEQQLHASQNKTLALSNKNGISLHLFEVFKPKEYIYIGQVYLSGEPYQAEQVDINNNIRKVWVFPLRIINEREKVLLPERIIREKQADKEKEAHKLSTEELLKRIQLSYTKSSSRREVSTSSYDRNPYVAEYTKRKANGVCQLCEKNAPFLDNKGNPYLEIHHIKWLSDGGEDSINNTVAICPNCHRKMHLLDLKEDREILRNKAIAHIV